MRLLLSLFLLVLPFVVVWVFLNCADRYARAAHKPYYRSVYYWAWIFGLVLSLGSFGVWWAVEQGNQSRVYVPAHWQDDTFVPGAYADGDSNKAGPDH